MGVWIKSGSRCEPAETNGISTCGAYALQGTRSRTAQHIAREMDSIGGNLDAFTGRRPSASTSNRWPTTCDCARCSDDWCSTRLRRGRHRARARRDSREIKMDEDNPDLLSTNCSRRLLEDIRWAGPFLAQGDGRQPRREKLLAYHSDRFHAATSSFGCRQLTTTSLFRKWRKFAAWPVVRRCMSCPRRGQRPHRDAQQEISRAVQLVSASRPAHHRRQPLRTLISTRLGGGMSSRLFQTSARSGHGLLIYSDLSPTATPELLVYAGTSAGKALEVVD